MESHSYAFNTSKLMKLDFLNSKQATRLAFILEIAQFHLKGLSLLSCAKDYRLPRGCQKFSKLTWHWVKSYSEKVHTVDNYVPQ